MQDVTKQLRQIEKEHLVRIENLYGQEGEILLNEIEKKEADFFADLDQKVELRHNDLIQMESIGEMANQRS
ncbi:MAG: hypothetical protein ACMG6E_04300 [Candidatus Roizmanbacteria bacterium]